MSYPINDDEFEEFVLTAVDKSADGKYWNLGFDGFGFGVPAREGIEPKVGSVIRQYGRGFGYTVRGCFIDGVEVYYRTVEQEEAHRQEELRKSNEERKAKFEANRAEYEADFRALPPEFQRRLTRFQKNNPDFRWKNEGYELFCCKESVKIAMALGSADAVLAFKDKDYEAQKLAVPTIAFDQHSGNTFGVSVRLAWLYVARPELVEREHGALCPLMGCRDYGCVPEDAKEYAQ